ncbi:WD and tetratricopeptide repeats protein 1 [Dorcoceras hygrometricum]|uniref:WD and tetratricopeptide repeats protein 1 n=1 Tax=Dorcoceras hygrometricum TaxID=472368 RepID=A0A2Z7CFR9_9LAMI|nr:WD and tetratricopeptide repeats protein 1 [Dorcoceras hygrometricum]
MESSICFNDGSISNFINSRTIGVHNDFNKDVQTHSSLLRRLSLESELELNIWSYSSRKLLHSIDTGHSANIFCTKFVPETKDELVVSGAGDAEVRLFNLSCLKGRELESGGINQLALFQCHTRRVKKLAVEPGNPNVVWSASEDGTLRQHDFRECASCPAAGSSHQECRNILLDLRCGAKKSLADPPKHVLMLKSCDINYARPHLLLVGGSDSFARLYDRRMLPPMSSSQKKMPSPPCVNYFCPMHLSDLGNFSLHLTHVTFSPNGEEILLSYSGEHVYLMDANFASGSTMRYTSEDVEKLFSFYPIHSGADFHFSMWGTSENSFPVRSKISAGLVKCRKLIQIAERTLKGESDYYYGIEACNEVLAFLDRAIEPTILIECLCIRASLLLKRRWKNDVHMAIRDCYQAREFDPSSVRALICMAEGLTMLNKHKQAFDFAIAAQALAPSDFEVMEKVKNIKKSIAAADTQGKRGSKSEYQTGRALSLSDIFYRSEPEDALIDGPEDSDYEELELDFETSISGEGGDRVDPAIIDRNLNLRVRRRDDTAFENGRPNGTCGSPQLSSKIDNMTYQPETVTDMRQRYIGHCNIGTDIKQASFVGQRGEYVASGSDDGRWFIWEKKSGRLLKMLRGDEAVVNCIQCHPYDCVIATSGIDSTIKIWTPNSPVPSVVAGGAAGPETSNVLDAMEENQHRLCRPREPIIPFEILEQFRMHEFAEGRFHPFECTQS